MAHGNDCLSGKKLPLARDQAEVIDFNRDDPTKVLKELTGGLGVAGSR